MVTAKEYFKDVGSTKEIELPSGHKFKIRKVQAREMLGGPMPFTEKSDLRKNNKEATAKAWESMSPDKKKEQLEFTDFLIEKSLVEPKLTKEQINDIPPEDYNVLIGEVTEFSFGKIKEVSPTKGATT